jgi:2'-5' RNA ligase
MPNIRTFIAVEISEEQRNSARRLIQRLSVAGQSYRWVDPENLHLTLSFLGDVPETEINQVCAVTEKAVAKISSFQFCVAGAGAFPDSIRPRVIWAGVNEGTDEFIKLQAAIQNQLSTLGFTADRRQYRPHLTLGRLKRAGRFDAELSELIEKHAEFDLGTNFADAVVIFSSFLDRSGPTYTPISTIELS